MTNQNPANISAQLKHALALHQQGQLAQAELLYRQILEIQPAQFDALHLLGVIAKQRGDAQAAVALFRRAIQVDGAQAIAHCNLGAALQELGLAQQALDSYDRALQLKPGYAMALNNRGNALRALGRIQEALFSYDAALKILPNYPEAFYNRGIALQAAGLAEQAMDAFAQALQLKPDYAAAHFALGAARQGQQMYPDALASYARAIQCKPDYAEAFCNRGIVQQRLHAYEDALESYERALHFTADYAIAHQYRGNVLRSLARPAEAIAAYQSALENGADAAQVNYALAALGVGATPPAAPPAYVKDLFNQYADHFDQHLLDVLQYEVPQRLAQAIARHTDATALDSLDVGCGTGLCGPLLRPYSRSLVGVDLSENMLNQARQREVYDQLVCAELAEFLSAQTSAYDLLVAADVFVYIGDLAAVFAGVRQALRSKGLFCFSVEASDADDFILRPSNRYAHSLTYLQRLADLHGLVIEESREEFARQDQGEAIAIFVLVMRRK